jgi:predicted RNA-binding Zn-ribbon protein involved in translation (DUF1610 family)
MRTFKCYDCKHTWQLPHGEGGRGVDLVCPQCGSKNIHREDKARGGGEGVVTVAESPGRRRRGRG